MAVTNFSAVRAGLLASLRHRKGDDTMGTSADPDNSKNVMSRFFPPFRFDDGVGVAAGTATGSVAVLTDGEGNSFNSFCRGEFSGTAPQIGAHDRGALLQMDASDTNDGLWIDLGYGVSAAEIDNCRGSFVVGTDDAFYLRVRLDITDVSDTVCCAVGFGKGGIPDGGVYTTLTDYAVLNVTDGNIKIETRDDSATASVTDTTQDMVDFTTTADVYDLEVRVSSSGVVNFLINGAEPTVDVNNYALDSGDRVNAFINVTVAGGTADPGVVLHEWESGFLSSRGLTGIGDVTVGT